MIYELPSEFGYVLLSILYSVIMNSYFFAVVFKARMDYNVKYPNCYADCHFEGEENSFKFNCI